jgi:hypothetical protein
MALEEVKKRFIEAVARRGRDDLYIDQDEEREILRMATQQGVSLESARGALAQVCDARGYVLESAALKQVRDLIDTFAGNDGRVDEKEFNDAVTTLKKATQGRRGDVQCKRLVLEIIEGNGYKVKTGLFRNWYSRAKKEVGMT